MTIQEKREKALLARKLKKQNRIDPGKSQKIVFTVYFFIFLLMAFICLYPMFWCLINSLKSTEEYYTSTIALPKKWNVLYYGKIFSNFTIGYDNFWTMTGNSLWMAFGGSFLNIAASVLVAYPLARYKFPLMKIFYAIIIFRITIPVVGAGPATYKFYREINAINNPGVFSLSYIMGFDMSALILYGYFKGVSKDYSEAAFMDGATRLQTLFNVVLPQALPCIVALYINQVMGTWNNYSTSMLYQTQYPNLAYGIYLFQDKALFTPNGMPMFFGVIIISALVPLSLFSAGQKLMLTNMSVGGLKG